MKTIIFDGRAFAKKKEAELIKKIAKLAVHPTMATVLVGDDPASKLYVSLKQKAAERIGAQMDVYEYPEGISKDDLEDRISHFDLDKTLSGIMIQLPLPAHLKEHTTDIINHIPKTRDVDGLREDSIFRPATARAVLSILNEAKKHVRLSPDVYTVVVGARGAVGSQIVRVLTELGYEVGGISSKTDMATMIKEVNSADVVISATGKPGLITGEMVKPGAIVIDVGSPRGDVVFGQVSKKAKFITPVPGGVGPVTVVSLMENLVASAGD